MSEIHAVVGAAILSFGAATGSYLSYKLFQNQKSNQGCLLVMLSETLIASIIGILHIYCYSCGCTHGTFTEIYELLNQTRQNETMVENCEESLECMYRKMLVEQLVLTIAALHSFISLVTSSTLCKKTDESPSTAEHRHIQTTVSIVSQWLLPIISAGILCYVMIVPNKEKLCEMSNMFNKVPENFQTLVSELLDNPINATEKSVFETEINEIVGKVYSIVESATQQSNLNQETDLDEGFQILNIIEKLNSQNFRKPKQINYDFKIDDLGFKIFIILFLLFGFAVPVGYSNITHTKLKMMMQVTEQFRDGTKRALQDKIKYLKMSMIAAATLWTPSIIETFSRTFITQSQPDILMHILMAIGSSYLVVRYGINLKLLKSFIGQQNSVTPKV